MVRVSVIVCILLLVGLPVFAIAQQPADPPVTDNLCFAGGALAGQCVTEAQWICGWYMAWYQRTGENFIPQGCAVLFPPGAGTPGAPVGESPLDNACYTGGSMAGTCHTEFDWICGWYVVRFQAGIFSRDQVLESCRGLIGGGGSSSSSSSGSSGSTSSTATRMPTPTPTATLTLTAGPTLTPSDTPTITATYTPTDTPTNTATSTATDTPTNTPTNTPTDTPTDTPTNTPTNTPTDTPTNTPTSTPTDTPTPV